MVIVLAVALSIIAVLATWLKKRHDRKRDHLNTSFNAGITTRSAPTGPNQTEKPTASSSTVPPPVISPNNGGRNSPARTRDAFMPYGYNYTRSESRLPSGASGSEDAIVKVPPPVLGGGNGRSSPLARGGTPVGELERGAGIEGTPTPTGQGKRKKVLVRERSVEDDMAK